MELNKIYLGRAENIMPTFPNECIDLTVTSPPYDNLRTYKGFVFDFETIARELYRVTKQGGVVVWVVGDATINGSETGTSFKQALYFKEIGFNLHDTMIYETEKPPLTHERYEQEFEYMFILSKENPKTFNPIKELTITAGRKDRKDYGNRGSKNENGCAMRFRNETGIRNAKKIKGNIWRYSSGGGQSSEDVIAFQHPAIFPEKLARDHIYSWSNEGDTVLDPMCGSGTTPKMAVLMNRNYLAIESAKEYYDLSVKRVGAYEQQINAEFQKAI